MQFRNTRLPIWILSSPVILAALLASFAMPLRAQDDGNPPPRFERHGRKYKAPPETSNIEVTVLKGFNQKPIVNAAVIFHPVDADGKDEGFLELKTDPDGKAKIDVIPTGSQVRIQVIATGFATYAEDYKIDAADRKITINMQRPRAQVSTFVDEFGKPSAMKPGVQDPVRPKLDSRGNPIQQGAANSASPGGNAPSNAAAGAGTNNSNSQSSPAATNPGGKQQ